MFIYVVKKKTKLIRLNQGLCAHAHARALIRGYNKTYIWRHYSHYSRKFPRYLVMGMMGLGSLAKSVDADQGSVVQSLVSLTGSLRGQTR